MTNAQAENLTAGFLTLERAKAFCANTSPMGAESDELVASAARAACQLVADKCGPIIPTLVTGEEVRARNGWAGTRYQATSVTTVRSLDGAALAGSFRVSAFGIKGDLPDGELLVDYQAGYAVPPEWAVRSAEIILRHLWKHQIGPRNAGQADPQGGAWTIPNSARDIMSEHLLPRAV